MIKKKTAGLESEKVLWNRGSKPENTVSGFQDGGSQEMQEASESFWKQETGNRWHC